MNNQETIEDLLLSTNRDGMKELVEHMRKIGFFTSPASTCHHMAKKGGLAEHSLNVFRVADALNNVLAFPCGFFEIAVAALLHDLGKCGQFGKAEYQQNVLKSGKVSDSKPYERNKELLPVDHEVRSVAIASQYIKLSEAEQYAILMHNGLYGPFKYSIQGNETPLYMLIHWADMWASRVLEA